MYRIKNDKRSLNSIKLVSDGLVKCLETKEFDNISISDIQKTTYVSRATFYRYFDSTLDVLVYNIDKIFENTIEKACIEKLSTKEVMIHFFDGWKRRIFLKLLFYLIVLI